MNEEPVSLVIQSPDNGAFLDKIVWNKDDFEQIISASIERYKNLVFTEDQLQYAKAERAKLNAMKKAISDQRIQIKKAVMAPYTMFEREVNEVVALIDEPIASIDRYINCYTEKKKDEKRIALESFFSEAVKDLSEVVKFEDVFDERYLNVSVSLSKAKSDIDGKLRRIREDLAGIDGFEAEYRLLAKSAYLKRFDIRDAYNEVQRIKAIKAAEAKAISNEPRQSDTPTEHSSEVPAVTPQKEAAVPSPDSSIDGRSGTAEVSHDAVDPGEKLYYTTYTAYGTKSQLLALVHFMKQNNIKFRKAVPKDEQL